MTDPAATDQLWQENARYFAQALEQIEPKDVKAPTPGEERSLRAKLRRQASLIKDLTSFLALPQDDWPLYHMPAKEMASVPVQECDEKCVHLQGISRKRGSKIVFAPGSTPYGAKAKRMYLRECAATKLFLAEEILGHMTGGTLTLKMTDALRPMELQQQYFAEIRQSLAAQGLEGQELYDRTVDVIADPDFCPPHVTGGAVDVTLAETQTGKDVDMGTGVDEIGNERIYLWHPGLSADQRRHRLLLFTAMTQAGFVNVPSEWWHYSFGDRQWALRTSKTHAMYGIVEK